MYLQICQIDDRTHLCKKVHSDDAIDIKPVIHRAKLDADFTDLEFAD